MRFQNTSRYPDAEVRRLVACGLRGIRTEYVAVHVKNCRLAYRGSAYPHIPRQSPLYGRGLVTRLVTIGIGPAERFPCDNLVTTFGPYRDLDPAERLVLGHTLGAGRGRILYAPDGTERHQVAAARRHPYGGKGSPLIEYADWREALVGVAAHEGRHLYQFHYRKPGSEVDCEQWAAAAVARYRAEGVADARP